MDIQPLICTQPADYAPIAAILNAVRPFRTTAAELAGERARWPEGSIAHLVAARDEGGRLLGFAEAYRFPNTAAGKFYVNVATHPASRRQGAGSALLKAIERFCDDQGGRRLVGEVSDTDAESLAWVQRRGYAVKRHAFDSALDLVGFDEAAFDGVVEGVVQRGIRFFTLAEAPQALQALYRLYEATMIDIPGYEAQSFMTFDTWRRVLIEGEGARPDWVFVAADGEQLVGVTQLVAHQDHVYTNHTLVDRAYRGRRIALALKLLAIRAARRHGAPYMRTGNDSLNAPMLAVNRRLGYRPLAGQYEVVLDLAAHRPLGRVQ